MSSPPTASPGTRIKVSGLTTPEDARLLADVGVDMAACVFYARSPRYVTYSIAWSIRRALPTEVKLYGVFVDAPLPLVQQIVYQCNLDGAQLFGNEPRAEVDAIKPYAFKAVTVDRPDGLDRAARAYLGLRPGRHAAPAILFHLTRAVQSDWAGAAPITARAPVLLASAALTPEHVEDALRTAHPWGIDAWETVESAPGRLDPARLKALCEAVRAADRALAGGR